MLCLVAYKFIKLLLYLKKFMKLLWSCYTLAQRSLLMQPGRSDQMDNDQKQELEYISPGSNQHITDVFISAKTSPVSTPIQAEAEGLLIATNIASSLLLQEPYFFTDNLGLAKAVQAHGGADPNVLWEIRRQAVQFQKSSQLLRPRIFHIKRSLNVLTHNCAHQAKTLARASPLCSCNNSTHTSSSCPVSVAINRLLPSEIMFVSV
jgi:hypothetical protein